MVPQVLQRVTSLPSISHLTITPAVLKNYCRRHVRYADYPGNLYFFFLESFYIYPPVRRYVDASTLQIQVQGSLCQILVYKITKGKLQGITPQAGSSVRGTFVTGLSDRDIARLDTFEGNQYERVKVLVWKLTIEGGGNGEGKVDEDEKIVASEQVEAETYVFMDLEDLEEEEWDYETFRREKMHRWIGSNEEYEGEFFLFVFL